MGHADINKQIKKYILVFIALLFLTFVTVAITRLEVSVPVAITLALIVASLKGTLVAGVFMHLFDEKRLIYITLALTVFFFIVLLLIPVLWDLDAVKVYQ